ncbi:MAG: winged helix-turn-helix domain-containing protein [Halobacteriaceae archaeon]
MPDSDGFVVSLIKGRNPLTFLLLSNNEGNKRKKMAHGNQKVKDSQILQVFKNSDDPYLTASEIAKRLNISRQGAHSRLLNLYENGELNRKKTGRTVGWWLETD